MKPAVHQYEDKLLELAYGELPPHEASAVEAHVQGCARCAQALGEIRAVRQAASALPPEPAPDAGLESLFAYAEAAARRNAAGPAGAAVPFWRRLVAPLAAVSALGLVVVVGWQTKNEVSELSPASVAVAEKARQDGYEGSARGAPPAPVVAQAAPAAAEDEAQGVEAQKPNAEVAEKVALRAKAGAKQAVSDEFDSLYGGDLGKSGNLERGTKEDRARAQANVQQALGATVPKDAPQAAQAEELRRDLQLATKAKPSKTRRAEDKKSANALADAAPAQDFSNAAQRGAAVPASEPAAAAPPPALAAAPPPPAPKSSLGFGLSGPSSARGAGGAPSGSASGGAGRAESWDDADVAAAAPRESEAKKKEQVARGGTPEELLKSARAAGSAGDRRGEVALALQALQQGARGTTRAEALQRACDGYDALGLEGQADAYCQALLREFPGTAAARAVATRRNQPQLRPQAAPARKAADLESVDPKAAEQPAKDKDSAPAQAY